MSKNWAKQRIGTRKNCLNALSREGVAESDSSGDVCFSGSDTGSTSMDFASAGSSFGSTQMVVVAVGRSIVLSGEVNDISTRCGLELV